MKYESYNNVQIETLSTSSCTVRHLHNHAPALKSITRLIDFQNRSVATDGGKPLSFTVTEKLDPPEPYLFIEGDLIEAISVLNHINYCSDMVRDKILEAIGIETLRRIQATIAPQERPIFSAAIIKAMAS